jgi:hypothetical protein
MHISNDFLMGFIIPKKSEVQLIIEKGSPEIGAGTPHENKVLIGVQIGKPHVSSHLHVDLF